MREKKKKRMSKSQNKTKNKEEKKQIRRSNEARETTEREWDLTHYFAHPSVRE